MQSYDLTATTRKLPYILLNIGLLGPLTGNENNKEWNEGNRLCRLGEWINIKLNIRGSCQASDP